MARGGRWRFAGLSLLIVACLVAGRSWPARSSAADDGPELAAILQDGRAVRPLFRPKAPARPGDWLAGHKEVGQTFAAFRAEGHPRLDASRTTLYVLPIGAFDGRRAELLDLAAEGLRRFYGQPVELLPPFQLAEIPPKARRVQPETGRRQIDSLTVLRLLARRRPADAVAVLALTTEDLWPDAPGESWNFVFGQASARDRVGVWSIARLGDPEAEFPNVLRRTLQVAFHETGHMLGFRHCTAFECGMNGSNSLAESDRQPLAFCPECVMKVWWTCRLDPTSRARRLADFAAGHDLPTEADTWRRSVFLLRPGSVDETQPRPKLAPPASLPERPEFVPTP